MLRVSRCACGGHLESAGGYHNLGRKPEEHRLPRLFYKRRIDKLDCLTSFGNKKKRKFKDNVFASALRIPE